MQRCLQIAKNGIGTTRPNPSVGAVIVFNGKIIGEGYTSTYGSNHAEVNAINSVKDKSLLRKSTLYVTLEPCSHFGKTPPCADFIIKNAIQKVVVGCIDTNSLVAGKGIECLKKAGVEVVVGVLETECKRHHKRFFTVQHKKRPYIILKWAETADGFIAPLTKNTQKPVWISNHYSQQLVHKWRSEEQAILVGTNTVISDNPSLTVRNWAGKNPTRIILDKNQRVCLDLNIFDSKAKTIVLTDKQKNNKKEPIRNNSVIEYVDFSLCLAKQICEVLEKHKIQSVIIEGGTQTLQSFIDANLWDEARIFIGKIIFQSGVEAPNLKAQLKRLETRKNIQEDILNIYVND